MKSWHPVILMSNIIQSNWVLVWVCFLGRGVNFWSLFLNLTKCSLNINEKVDTFPVKIQWMNRRQLFRGQIRSNKTTMTVIDSPTNAVYTLVIFLVYGQIFMDNWWQNVSIQSHSLFKRMAKWQGLVLMSKQLRFMSNFTWTLVMT